MLKKIQPKLSVLIAFIITNALYLTIFFIIIKEKNISFYLALIFTIISVVIGSLLIFRTMKKGSLLFEYPIYYLSLVYYLVQIVTSCILFILKIDKFVLNFVPQLLILVIYIIVFLIVDATNRTLQDKDKDIKKAQKNISDLVNMVIETKLTSTSEKIKLALENLEEKIKYSDPVTIEAISKNDEIIRNNVTLINTKINYLLDEEVIKMINNTIDLIKIRNEILKANK